MKKNCNTPPVDKLGGLESKLRALMDTPNLGTGDKLKKGLKDKYEKMSYLPLGPEDINENYLVDAGKKDKKHA